MKLLTVMLILSWLITNGLSACNDRQVKASEKVMKVPAIDLLKLDSSGLVKTDTLAKGKPLIFMFFESDCHMCQEEISGIISNAPISRDWKILLISRQPLDSIRNFVHRNNLTDLEQIKAYKDPGFAFFTTFEMKGIPSTIIYNAHGQLKMRYEGQIDVYQIKEMLEKDPA